MRVEYYFEPKDYFKSLSVNSDELHIISSSTLEQYFKNNLFKDNKLNIVLIKDIEKILYPNWNNTIEQIRMSCILRDIIEKLNIGEKEKYSYLKELNSILEIIRYFAEVGVKEVNDDLIESDKGLSRKQKDIMKIFNEFINDPKIIDSLKEFDSAVNSNIFAQKVQRFNNTTKGIKGQVSIINKIYIYNNVKLDIKTYLILKKLNLRGIEVVFRINFTKELAENCPNYNNLYNTLFKDVQLPSKELSSNFMKYLSGKPIENNYIEDILFKSFENPSKFKQYLREYPVEKKHTYEGIVKRHYVANSSDVYNEYFKDVILDKNRVNDKNIFFYPEGNFLINLYNIKLVNGDYEVTFNDLFRCITSGWVEVKSGAKYISGKRAMSLLIDLQDYFNGCKSIKDYLERTDSLELLIEFKNKFDDLGESKANKDKVKQYLLNPLKVFSYLNSDRYEVTIKQLRDLISRFKKICDVLLHDEMLDVNSHLTDLKETWDNLSINSDPDAEPLLFNNISESLRFEAEEYELMSFYEMRSLIISLTTNNSDEDGTDIKIKALNALEGIILEDVNEINIVDLTEKSIERLSINNGIHKMLNVSFIQKWIEYSNLNNVAIKRIFEIHKLWVESLNDFLRYNLAMVFENFSGTINIFYINGIFENDNKSSFYNIIKNIYDSEEQAYEGYPVSYFDFIEDHEEESEVTKGDINIAEYISPVGLLDIDFCHRKFFLSNIIASNPVYSSELHQQFVFTSLSSLFFGENRSDNRVHDIFFKLFPQWTDTLKENLVATSYSRNINTRYTYKNVNFPYYMKDIQILRSKYGLHNKVRDAYKEKRLKANEYVKSFIDGAHNDSVEARPGSHCSMCPHQYLCTKGEWVIDRFNY